MLVSSFPNRKLNLRFGFFYANLQQPLSQPSADSIPTPFVPSGHFPLIGGIGPLSPRGAFGQRKRASRLACSLACLRSDRTLNLVGTQASCADIYMARSTVNDCLDTFDVGLPCTVGTSVGVRDLDTEGYALTTKITLSHFLAPPIR